MIAKAHPINLDGRKRNLDDLDLKLRSRGFPDFHGVSTYPDGTVAIVVTNDHTDAKYGELHENIRLDTIEWDTTHEKDGREKVVLDKPK